nr:Chain C, nonameric peptide from Lysosomal protective protein [Homo sapiens]3BP7_C Chain C, nonameric peptide from Lysosomal protective protein [Homo sapiens]3BXN_C Chain C, Cathepsin A signal sequence octapeptide [synthetic construct]
IRAAPPPLF